MWGGCGNERETVHIPPSPSPLPLSVCCHRLLQPATSPSLTHVNNGSEGFRPSAFSPCPNLSSFFSYILTFSRSVSLLITAALLFTFIRWRRFQGQLWPVLSHKEEAWILFGVNDLGAISLSDECVKS